MEIKVDLSPEQINQQIADAIAKSAIGVELEKIIREEVSKLGNSFNNPIRKVIERMICDSIIEVLNRDHAQTVAQFVKEQITQEIMEDLLKAAWDAFRRKL